MGQKREKRLKPPCADPESGEYGKHRWSFGGADARFARCRWCGKLEASSVSNEARYARVPIAERAVAHHHLFELSPLDTRYERCFCGATRASERIAERIAESAGAA